MRRWIIPALAALTLGGLASPARAVVGGKDVPQGRFPYVAFVDISGQASCTGDLVAPTWVLTAGHCAAVTGAFGAPTPFTLPPSAYRVTLGTVNADHTGGETIAVKSVRPDPGYAVTNGTGHDVALLELDRAAKETPVTIAAPVDGPRWAPGRLLTIAGFGTTAENGSAPPTMQMAQVPRVSDADCAKAYSDTTPVAGNAFDPRTALCAGYKQGRVDTCEGDSGGPLLIAFGAGARLVGATSYGNGCARPDNPGVYARLTEGPEKAFIASLVPSAFSTTSITCAGTRGLKPSLARRLPRQGTKRVKVHGKQRTYVNCRRL